MLLRNIAFTLAFLLTFSSIAIGDQANLQFQRIRGDYSSLIKSTQDKLYRDNWLRIIDEFRRFSNQYPTHSKGPAALYMAGRACEELHRISLTEKDALQAAEIYDDVDVKFPNSSLADDALVLSAQIHDTILKDTQEAVSRYSRVIQRYPGGDQIKPARQALSRLSPYALEAALKPPPKTAPAPEKAKSSPAAGPCRLVGIRSESQNGFSRVVLDLTKSVDFSYNTLPGDAAKNIAPRLYVDLRETNSTAGIPSRKTVQDPVLQCIRTGQAKPDQVRVVLDLNVLQDFRVFTLDNPSRLVIDVAAQKTAWDSPQLALQQPAAQPRPDGISKILENTSTEKSSNVDFAVTNQNSELKLIVVDPGHGGKDPGAIGPNGVKEKNVVLAIAKILAKRLEDEFNCKVVLTRDRDKYLALEERTDLANRLNADLFISIHANANPNRKIRGIETYYLNFSKNKAAATVAARENGITLKEVSDLELILFDLMANSKINESSLLANKVQKGVVQQLAGKYSSIKDHGVRQGPFHVLVGATMPSILVEAAYISNRHEESRLISRSYQDRVAKGIVDGVRGFATTLDMVAKK